jgi:LL-diaminopimelate aminotransferase
MVTESQGGTRAELPHFSEIARAVEALRAEGTDVIRMDVGSPDMPPAAFIIEALQRSAAQADHHGYQPFRGPLPLRRAWSAMYRRVFDVELDPQTEVLPLLGSKEGILHLTLANLHADEIVLVPDPGYPTYAHSVRLVGAVPQSFPLDASRGHLPNLSEIPGEILKKARLMWLNYPNNPTTATADLAALAEAVEFARAHDVLICHDAAYTQVSLDGKVYPSMLQVPGAKDVAVEFNSLSKSHNMAGWRLGVAVGNPAALERLMQVKADADNGHFLAITDAAIEALTGDQTWIAERNAIYRKRAEAVVRGLEGAGLGAEMPKATMYVWARLPDGWRSQEFAGRLLREAAVAVTPGDTFGIRGEGYVRIALAASLERIEEGMYRLRRWLAGAGS